MIALHVIMQKCYKELQGSGYIFLTTEWENFFLKFFTQGGR